MKPTEQYIHTVLYITLSKSSSLIKLASMQIGLEVEAYWTAVY